jgi:hypothetical protein
MMKKRIKLPKFTQSLLVLPNGRLQVLEADAPVPEHLQALVEPVSAVKLLTAALDTPTPGSHGYTPADINARSKLERTLAAAEGKSSVDLEPRDYNLIKQLYSATPWQVRHRIFADMEEAIEAATDYEASVKEKGSAPADQ